MATVRIPTGVAGPLHEPACALVLPPERSPDGKIKSEYRCYGCGDLVCSASNSKSIKSLSATRDLYLFSGRLLDGLCLSTQSTIVSNELDVFEVRKIMELMISADLYG